MSKDVTRLFEQFQPEHYDLHITPNAHSLKFKGTVTIRGKKTGKPTQRLTLHQHALKIISATVTKHDKKGDQDIALDRTNTHARYDEVRLHSPQMIYPGDYTITIEFSGQITRHMNGLYPCFFQHDGKEKKLLATQFESHHAREVFPCIDEPEAKATFDLSLTTPKDDVVIANTPELKVIDEVDDHKTTIFQTTPRMSVYLVAFVIGEMGYKEATTKDGVTIRTYATPDNVQFTDFALDVAVKCLEFYNDYFDIPYPLPKCDMIALPDFASGAMENWGCITYREHCMLYDPKNTSLPTKQYIAMVVAHELAHQWFGNLVTMRWWTDLWLNEGFASWIEYLAIDKLFPEWQMWTQFITDEQHGALRLDALDNTHPVEVPVRHPDEIRSIFDTISYCKGASVIHMLHEHLSPAVFRDGLRHYLKKHAYQNTDTIDLWHSLAEVSKKPVESFMATWTSEPGFPIIKAHRDDGVLSVKQERYYTNPLHHSRHHKVIWPIPLAGKGVPDLLDQPAAEWHLDEDYVKLNSGQGGFYRVAYNRTYLHKLAEQVPTGKLSPLDRLGLLSDAIETAKAGYSRTTQALDLLQYYQNEDNNAVWDIIGGTVNAVRVVMNDEELRDSMKPFVRKLVAKQLDRLGWEPKPNEVYFDSLLRPTILGLASISDEPSVVAECLQRFEKMKKPQDIPPDLRGLVYSTAARHGDQTTFNRLLKLYRATDQSEEQITIAAALTSFKQPELIKKSLALITTDTVRLQDIGHWVAYSFMNRHGKHLAWKWLTKNWDWLNDNLGKDLSFSRFPIYAARCFSDEDFLPEFKHFFASKMTPSLERAYNQGVETVEWQAAWKARDLEQIKQFFTDQANNPSR